MPTVKFVCSICGFEFYTSDNALECEKSGVPVYKFKVKTELRIKVKKKIGFAEPKKLFGTAYVIDHGIERVSHAPTYTVVVSYDKNNNLDLSFERHELTTLTERELLRMIVK